jgi:hypothetical protein
MTVIEHDDASFEGSDAPPAWWRPGMAEDEEAVWRAAESAAARAPEIMPGSDLALRLGPLLADFGDGIRTARNRRHTTQNPAA